MGDEYQDLVAIELFTKWLIKTDSYKWILLEGNEAGYLDDIVVMNNDDTLTVRQVKYSIYPDSKDDPWGWETLLATKKRKNNKRNKSLLQKWASSLSVLQEKYPIKEASLFTNRKPMHDLQETLSPDGTVSFEKITDPGLRLKITKQLGGEDKARKFFQSFSFKFNRPNLINLEKDLQERFYSLNGTELGWQNLVSEVREWVSFKNLPSSDGHVELGHIRRASRWHELRSLPQEFEIPEDYVLPSEEFHSNLIFDIEKNSEMCRVIWGTPGVGKSTYSSFLFEELLKYNIPVIRHHFYLSNKDPYSYQRLDHRQAAESLMKSMLQNYEEGLRNVSSASPRPEDLRLWLEALGNYFGAKGKSLVVIIDGLDHVWREKKSIEELDKLMSYLLPAPSAVKMLFVTQKIAEEFQPRSLIRYLKTEDWVKLPLLDRQAIHLWLKHHELEISVQDNKQIPPHIFDELVEALYERTKGHPLHLRYTFKAIQERNLLFTRTNLLNLPECPHDDITKYYALLWQTLQEESRQILHLLSISKFLWPRNGLFECLDPMAMQKPKLVKALNDVMHMLEFDEAGIKPFHSSLFQYCETIQEHDDYRGDLIVKTINWLRNFAPEYWKWAYTWILEAQNSNEEQLIGGPSRAWCVDAITQKRFKSNIFSILESSIEYALKANSLKRTIEIGLVNDYCFNAFEFMEENLNILTYSQFLLLKNRSDRKLLRSRINELSTHDVVLLAEIEAASNDALFVGHCLQEIESRTRYESMNQGFHGNKSVRTQVTPILSIAALAGVEDTKNAIEWAQRNRENGYSALMLEIFFECLRRYKNIEGIRQALKILINRSDSQVEANYLSAVENENSLLLQNASLLALQENIDIDNLLIASNAHTAIYAFMRGKRNYKPGLLNLPDLSVLEEKHVVSSFEENPYVNYFYEIFFKLMANYLYNNDAENKKWLLKVSDYSWPRRYIQQLSEIAFIAAENLKSKRMMTYGEFYKNLNRLEMLSWAQERDLGLFEIRRSAKAAALRISFDLRVVFPLTTRSRYLTKSDLNAAFNTEYCNKYEWMRYYIDQRYKWINLKTAKWLIDSSEKEFMDSIEYFNERAEKHGVLASIAAMHSLDQLSAYHLQKASENIISHYQHKDMLLNETLDVVRTGNFAKSKSYLLRIAPIIAEIDKFTDGDETAHLTHELGGAVLEKAPELFVSYYQWLCKTQQYYDAKQVLRHFCEKADLSNGVNQSIIKTVVGPEGLSVLLQRMANGDENAKDIIKEASMYLGSEAKRESKDNDSINRITKREETVISAASFPPEMFTGFMNSLRESRAIYFEENINHWIDYWVLNGQGVNVLEAIMEAEKKGIVLNDYDKVFVLANTIFGKEFAYPWLVKAHQRAYGWNRYWTDKEKAVARWAWVKKLYPEKWSEFIVDTFLQKNEWRGVYSIGQRSFVRLVEYCLYMDKGDYAADLADVIVDSALEYVKPLAIKTLAWT